MNTFYTSDWHIGDDRINIEGKLNLMLRPFNTLDIQHQTIYNGLIQQMKDGDTLYHLGDVVYNFNYIDVLIKIRNKFPKSKFHLISGNYDDKHWDELGKYFDTISMDNIIDIDNIPTYLNHYPIQCKETQGYNQNLCGHIHSLWKVKQFSELDYKKNIINVGVDAWNFQPVSEPTLKFVFNGMNNHYDSNVFLQNV